MADTVTGIAKGKSMNTEITVAVSARVANTAVGMKAVNMVAGSMMLIMAVQENTIKGS